VALSEFFDREAGKFADGYITDPEFRARAELWSSLIDRHSGGARTCLDLGCGPGVQARNAAARGLATVAIDLSVAMIARVPATANLEVRVGDFMSAELGPADLVLCSSVLEYVVDLERAIGRIAMLVRDGGTVLASLPNSRSLYRRAERIAFRISGRPAYRRWVGPSIALVDARGLFAAHGLQCRELVYYARFAPLLPDTLAANLAVFVLDKVSNSSTKVRAMSASS
jgi:2-polyprenyl-6-hydroxyphenyl methylase/3-demethylubiquinone-9 3-methyltransferase